MTKKNTSTKLLISGAKKLTVKELYYLDLLVRRCTSKKIPVITGDEPGTDKLVLSFAEVGSDVAVYGSSRNPSNELAAKLEPTADKRDKLLVADATQAVIFGQDARSVSLIKKLSSIKKKFKSLVDEAA